MDNQQINISLLKKLIEIKTISSKRSNSLTAIRLIKNKLKKERIPVLEGKNNGFPYLIAGQLEKDKIVFLSHIDVVPAKPNQFNLKVKGDKLIGRGTLDMKGPMLVALETFISLWKAKRKKFVFAVTSDEEIGGFNGALPLSKTKLKNITAGIILDSTHGFKLVIGQKAPFHIKITHTGKSAHGSRPWLGSNSAEKIAQCSLQIKNLIHQKFQEGTTAAVTQIQSGNTINTIPDQAFTILDIRIKQEKNFKSIIRTLNQQTKKFGCHWEKIDDPLFFEVDPRNDFIKKWVKEFIDKTGKKPNKVIEAGASDARFLYQETKSPILVVSAEGSGAHSSEEWVSHQSLIDLKKLLLGFCLSLSSPKRNH